MLDCPNYNSTTIVVPVGIPRCNLSYGINPEVTFFPQITSVTDPNFDLDRQPLFSRYKTIRFGSVRQPDKSILLTDRVMANDAHWTDGAAIAWNYTGSAGWNECPDGGTFFWSHGTGINVVRYDGSVLYITRRQAYEARSSSADLVWNLLPKPGGQYVNALHW